MMAGLLMAESWMAGSMMTGERVTGGGRHVWLYAIAGGDVVAGSGVAGGDAAGRDIADGAGGLIPAGLTGVGGNAVRLVSAAGLAAVVSDVPEPEFGEAGLRRNLEDLRWLEQTAREHHGVIEVVAGRGPAVPTRLATVYDSDLGLAAELERRSADLRRALAQVAAGREWGVRGYAAPGPGAGTTGVSGTSGEFGASRVSGISGASGSSGSPGSPGSSEGGAAGGDAPVGAGAAYLNRRRTQLNASESARREAAASAQAVHSALSGLAAADRIFPPQSPELSAEAKSMILNAAYLVDRDREQEFQEAFTSLTRRHGALQLVLTGPWPAYSFAADFVDEVDVKGDAAVESADPP